MNKILIQSGLNMDKQIVESENNKAREIVIGLVQPVGTNSIDIIACIKDCLKQFDQETDIIKVSEKILEKFDTKAGALEKVSEYERIKKYMDLGNWARNSTGEPGILMAGVAGYIFTNYHYANDKVKPSNNKAYIIDSIKHPGEVEYLRKLYGDGFHLIGITDSLMNRKSFLIERKNMTA